MVEQTVLLISDTPAALEVTAETAPRIIRELIVKLRVGRKSRERSLAITKLEEAITKLAQDGAGE